MDPLRNWTLIAAAYAVAAVALLWFTVVDAPDGTRVRDVLDDPRVATGPWWSWFAIGASLALAAYLIIVTWFVLSNRDMNKITQGWFATPMWTLLLFAPLIQFVSAYMMARHIHVAQQTTGRTGMHPVTLFVFMWLLVPIGIAVAQLQMQRILPAASGPAAATTHSARESPLFVPVRPEILPMPASGVAALAFCIASLPLAILGPAGIAAGLCGLYARERFLDLEARIPGHKGARAIHRLQWTALSGIVLSSGVSAWMLAVLVVAT